TLIYSRSRPSRGQKPGWCSSTRTHRSELLPAFRSTGLQDNSRPTRWPNPWGYACSSGAPKARPVPSSSSSSSNPTPPCWWCLVEQVAGKSVFALAFAVHTRARRCSNAGIAVRDAVTPANRCVHGVASLRPRQALHGGTGFAAVLTGSVRAVLVVGAIVLGPARSATVARDVGADPTSLDTITRVAVLNLRCTWLALGVAGGSSAPALAHRIAGFEVG